MLKIRLQRVGRVHQPAFRLVLTESVNSTKSGRFKEVLGSYDPRKTNEALKADRIKYWLEKGVIPTPSVWNLLIKKGVVKGKKMHNSADAKPQVIVAAPEPEIALEVESAPVEEVAEVAEAPAPEVEAPSPEAEVPPAE